MTGSRSEIVHEALPTDDPKVRQAIAAAVDVNVINQRVYAGKGLSTTAMFHESFPFDPKVPGPTYDVNKAKQLVTEAKTAGSRSSATIAPSAARTLGTSWVR